MYKSEIKMQEPFLDTNVILSYLTRDEKLMAERALALLLKIESNEEQAFTTHLVIAEVIFTLQHYYKVSRNIIHERIRAIISMDGLEVKDK